jgi:hypothetical protein
VFFILQNCNYLWILQLRLPVCLGVMMI